MLRLILRRRVRMSMLAMCGEAAAVWGPIMRTLCMGLVQRGVAGRLGVTEFGFVGCCGCCCCLRVDVAWSSGAFCGLGG